MTDIQRQKKSEIVEKHKETYIRIGLNIKNARTKAKLSQDDLAAKTAKLDRAKISDMEHGKEDFMFSTLLEVANGLNIDVERLTKKERVAKKEEK